MNLESIIIAGVCLVAIGVVGYLLWKKIEAQKTNISLFEKRLESIELMFAHPPSREELNSVFGTHLSTNEVSESQTLPRQKSAAEYTRTCEEGLCEMRPLVIDPSPHTEDDLDVIAEKMLQLNDKEKQAKKTI